MTGDPRPFPLQALVPAELREVLRGFVWDAGRLRRLPLPVGTATVDSLRWQLDLLDRNGRWVILDGVHRLLKADLLGLGDVRVRRLPAAMLPRILPAATEELLT